MPEAATTAPREYPGGQPLRTTLAIAIGRLAAWLSRTSGIGGGSMIGGRITLKLDGRALYWLSRGKRLVVVTGTNGKTTTTLMIARSLATAGKVASNHQGANMPDGVVAALTAVPDAAFAVLEVDENYFPYVTREIDPAAVVLLNLSRDQLDRVGEVRTTERELRKAITTLDRTTVIANCDDVLVTSAAADASRPVWVRTGQKWRHDSVSCPRCAGAVAHHDDWWHCESCGLRKPAADWSVVNDAVTGVDGVAHTLRVALPGDHNRANAAMAVAAAETVGVTPGAAVEAISGIADVCGRYRTVRRSGHSARLILAKNPAGWAETLPLLTNGDPVVAVVNAREADGKDLSWLWDVPFEALRGTRVVASGERAADLSVRLRYADVKHETEPDPVAALDGLPAGSVQLVANYTAFRDVTKRLDHDR